MLNMRCNGEAICECDAKDFDILVPGCFNLSGAGLSSFYWKTAV